MNFNTTKKSYQKKEQGIKHKYWTHINTLWDKFGT